MHGIPLFSPHANIIVRHMWEKTINFKGPKSVEASTPQVSHSNFAISRWKEPGFRRVSGLVSTPGRTRRAEAPRGCWDVEFRYPGLLEGSEIFERRGGW